MPAKRVLVRQVWLGGVAKVCGHERLQTLQTEGGKPLVDVCGLCGFRLAEYGPCDFCGVHDKRLVKFVGMRRFCGGSCQTGFEAKKKADAKARRAEFKGERGMRGARR